ncbi:hypothetical protein ENUP19_0246G0019 [Entamoeba nuttalli]|uniref:Uncharacterized protein n=2 Tax=Entamoeba nuttalli TaxID=412467 RepID=K2H2E5_ENTNP|nr:hypothetical protein ENU1_049250 [Entamoeba nuttalli P19]EKE41633.1 hypothetical protein ENU1_049250 [Entamoeba nuttalli P19]|eukprot:XP_008856034.1 hypothetical protein ENU1_049250 [Entamoeba nuttalli P19]
MSWGFGNVLKIHNETQLLSIMEELNNERIAITTSTVQDYCIFHKINFDESLFQVECSKLNYFKMDVALKDVMTSSPMNVINDFHKLVSVTTHRIPKEFIFFIDEVGYQLTPTSILQYVKRGTEHEPRILERESKQSNVCVCICSDGSFLPLLVCLPKKYISSLIDKQYIYFCDVHSLFYSSSHFINWFCGSLIQKINAKRKKYRYYGESYIILNVYYKQYLIPLMDILRQNKIQLLFSPKRYFDYTEPMVQITFMLEKYIVEHCFNNVIGLIDQPKLKVGEMVEFLLNSNKLISDCCDNFFFSFNEFQKQTHPTDSFLCPEPVPYNSINKQIIEPLHNKLKSCNLPQSNPQKYSSVDFFQRLEEIYYLTTQKTTNTQNNKQVTLITEPKLDSSCSEIEKQKTVFQDKTVTNKGTNLEPISISSEEDITAIQNKNKTIIVLDDDQFIEPIDIKDKEEQNQENIKKSIEIEGFDKLNVQDNEKKENACSKKRNSNNNVITSTYNTSEVKTNDNTTLSLQAQKTPTRTKELNIKQHVHLRKEKEENLLTQQQNEKSQTVSSLKIRKEETTLTTPNQQQKQDEEISCHPMEAEKIKSSKITVFPTEKKYHINENEYIEIEIRKIPIKQEVIEELFEDIQNENKYEHIEIIKQAKKIIQKQKEIKQERKVSYSPVICISTIVKAIKESINNNNINILTNIKTTFNELITKEIAITKTTFKMICDEYSLSNNFRKEFLKETNEYWKHNKIELKSSILEEEQVNNFLNKSKHLLNNLSPSLFINIIDIGKQTYEKELEVLTISDKKCWLDIESRMSWIICGITGSGEEIPSLCCLPKTEIEELKLVFEYNTIFVEQEIPGLNKKNVNLWMKEYIIPWINFIKKRDNINTEAVIMLEEGMNNFFDYEELNKQKIKLLIVPKGGKNIMPITKLENKIELEWFSWGELSKRNKQTFSFGVLNILKYLTKQEIKEMFDKIMINNNQTFSLTKNVIFEMSIPKLITNDFDKITLSIEDNIDAITTFDLKSIEPYLKKIITKIITSSQFSKLKTKGSQIEYCFSQYPLYAEKLLQCMRINLTNSKQQSFPEKKEND